MKIKKQKKQRNSTNVANQKTAVFSYYRSDNKQTSQLPKKDKKRVSIPVISKLVYALIIITTVSALTYFSFIKNTEVSVKDVVKNTTEVRSDSEYLDSVNSFIDSSVLNQSKITFDNDGLIKKLKEDFPEIQTVELSTSIFTDVLTARISITKPVFALETSNKIVIVGENGVALSVNDKSQANDTKGLKRVVDSSGVEPELGKPVFPKEQALFIAIVNEQLEKQSINVSSLEVTTSPYDLHVRLEGRGYYVKFNILEDPLQQAGALASFIKNQESRGVVPVEYVDVRVEERLFYK